MNEDEVIYNKILAVITAILCIFISIIITIFIGITKVEAYATIDYSNDGSTINSYIQPTNNRSITNVSSDWGESGVTLSSTTPWMIGFNQYWGAGSVSGSNIVVNADYYIGIKGELYADTDLTSYLSTTRNTLTSSNLRCGVGSAYKSGYNSTYLPEVTNFNVTLTKGTGPFGNNWLFHITYNYKQRIPSITLNNTNMSCWFERQPSNGLIAQVYTGQYTSSIHYYYYNSNFQYAITDDPNTAALNTITNQNNTIINQNTEINNSLEDINDTLEGEDFTEEEKEPVNKDKLNDYKNKESELLNEDNLNNIYEIEIGLDGDTLDYIWDLVTRILQTNTIIYGLVISILSIGIIKLILNR